MIDDRAWAKTFNDKFIPLKLGINLNLAPFHKYYFFKNLILLNYASTLFFEKWHHFVDEFVDNFAGFVLEV